MPYLKDYEITKMFVDDFMISFDNNSKPIQTLSQILKITFPKTKKKQKNTHQKNYVYKNRWKIKAFLFIHKNINK